jgi:hypothetical protein
MAASALHGGQRAAGDAPLASGAAVRGHCAVDLRGADLLDAPALPGGQLAVVLLPGPKPELQHLACEAFAAGLSGFQPHGFEHGDVFALVAAGGSACDSARAAPSLPAQHFVGVFALQPSALAILVEQLVARSLAGPSRIAFAHHARVVFKALFHQSWLHLPRCPPL